MSRVRYLIGLATLAGAGAAGYWLYDMVRSRERTDLFALHVEFRDARGLKAGADVKHRGVPVGSVRRVELRDDGQRAVIDLVMQPEAAPLVRYGTRFWIVTPRFLGLTQGATGLDTLIRDAYISFASPEGESPPLPSGSQVIGAERPAANADVSLEPFERGDLAMTLLVPENHDLAPGARVVFRGVPTGELRSAKLAPDGSHVQLELRIRREYRHTVTDRSQFWVARPRLSGALISGFALEDAAALLSPFIGYHTEAGAGVPVVDGHRAAALNERPDMRIGPVPSSALAKVRPDAAAAPKDEGIRVVRVYYEAVERDFWSPDDEIKRDGCGLLLEDSAGRSVVLTTRSVCDGTYFVADGLGTKPDIDKERIRVGLTEGSVVQASRTWTAPDGLDLAVLVLQDSTQSGSDGRRLDFSAGTPGTNRTVQALDEQVKPMPPVPLADADLAVHRGAVVIDGDRVVGLLGQTAIDDLRPSVVALAQVPQALRPKQ